jgi:hypothetical protein
MLLHHPALPCGAVSAPQRAPGPDQPSIPGLAC